MNIGILGTGFGAFHAGIYKEQAAVRSIKLFGRNPDRLNQLKERFQITVTDRMEEIITDPAIDLVDVCLPSELHREAVIAALRHGKDVFCETPVSFTLEDAAAMQEAARQTGRRLFINLFIKFTPEYQYIRQAIRQNSYGALKFLRVKRKTAPLWGDLGLERIPVALMLHDLDFITWLLGQPTAVSAKGLTGQPGQSHVQVHLHYPGAIVELTGNSMMPRSYPFTVGYEALFENGAVEFNEQCFETGDVKQLRVYSANGQEEPVMDQADPYVRVIQHVLHCCQHNIEDTVLTAGDAIQALGVAVQLRESLLKANM